MATSMHVVMTKMLIKYKILLFNILTVQKKLCQGKKEKKKKGKTHEN